jgi:hypothetical protein
MWISLYLGPQCFCCTILRDVIFVEACSASVISMTCILQHVVVCWVTARGLAKLEAVALRAARVFLFLLPGGHPRRRGGEGSAAVAGAVFLPLPLERPGPRLFECPRHQEPVLPRQQRCWWGRQRLLPQGPPGFFGCGSRLGGRVSETWVASSPTSRSFSRSLSGDRAPISLGPLHLR